MIIKNEWFNKHKNVFLNMFVIITVSCLLIAAVEGIGLRQKVYYGENDLYYLNVINLSKIALINEQINNSLNLVSPYNVLYHDTYGLLVAGLTISFLSALIPLLTSFIEVKEEKGNNKIFLVSRLIAFVGVILVLVSIVFFVLKFTNITNSITNSKGQDIYTSASQIFDMGAFAGILILICVAGLLVIFIPKKLR
ncbi:unknown transmembrane protein [Mesoplasma florum W37]|uniref:Uncharacterized protein n=1 Tax=Mesoplasma florum TaxID=2151 RepID=A0AAD0HSI4_MESFO|nr:hypothetical protein [Mesoplasma florum]AGY41770.1 unknown transmembrane protein [Mesoplasma florum W37]AVN59970.1 hypothetical protein CG008_03690 [Mesoplasma florum]AVN66109.1 hypothetical protein MflW12_7040 [Mesoplasma florum]